MNVSRLAALACAAFVFACDNPAPKWYGGAGASGRATGSSGSGGQAERSQSSMAEPAAAGGAPATTPSAPVPAPAGGMGGAGAGGAAAPVTSAPATGGAGGKRATGAAGSQSGGAGAGGTPAAVGGNGPGQQDSRSGARTAEGFMNLAPPLGEPLDGKGKALTPAAPSGWVWYEIAGAVCRDGSPTGFYVHEGTVNRLLIFLEGGGMCSNASFCSFNPANVNQVLSGDAQTVVGSVFGAISGRQQPGVYTQSDHTGPPRGIFDFADARNPVRDWSQIYVPYCTGDVHFGSKKNGSVPGLSNQQFVGHQNLKLFISRIVPTFKDRVDYVLLSGANAGGFGALLNLSMVQDAFGDVAVDALSDSGPPMDDKYMPVCMQKRWREAWGFADSLPPDCEECKQADGGGLLKLAEYLIKKHPVARFGMISSTEDEVIRLAYSVGANNCANSDTADPIALSVAQLIDPSILMPAADFTQGLTLLRDTYLSTKRLSTFYKAGSNPTYTEHLFRADFYETVNGTTLAQFLTNFVDGKIEQIGP